MGPSQRLSVASSLLARTRPIAILSRRSPVVAATTQGLAQGLAQGEGEGGLLLQRQQRQQQQQQWRALHAAPARLFPRVGSEDKDSINRESIEYTRSGTDSETAEQKQAAFDPSITDPQTEKEKAGEGMGVSYEARQQRATTVRLLIPVPPPPPLPFLQKKFFKSSLFLGPYFFLLGSNIDCCFYILLMRETVSGFFFRGVKILIINKKDNKNPLNVSPANPDVSKPRASNEGHPEHAPGEQRHSMSGGGSGMKNKK